MAINTQKSLRKSTGGRYTNANPKRAANLAGSPRMTDKGSKRVKTIRVRGGDVKNVSLSVEKVNLLDPKKGSYMQATFQKVKESAANRNYVRRNIITKGSIIVTDKGEAKVTSRPGQQGAVSAVLI